MIKTTPFKSGSKALCLLDMISMKNPILCEKLNKGKNINISCLQDKQLQTQFYKCEIASASFVLALLAKLALGGFDELDEGYLSAESCLGEEEALEIIEFLKEADCIVFDENLKRHKDFKNIKFFLHCLANNFKLELILSDESEEELEVMADFKTLKELDNYDSFVVFKAKGVKNLLVSRQFLHFSKLQDNDELIILPLNIQSRIKLDERLQGTIAFLDFENEGFDFVKVELKKIYKN